MKKMKSMCVKEALRLYLCIYESLSYLALCPYFVSRDVVFLDRLLHLEICNGDKVAGKLSMGASCSTLQIVCCIKICGGWFSLIGNNFH